MQNENKELFESMDVGRAVLTMSVPMVISQAITVVYNVADTFFVGQLNSPEQIAAVTVSLPLFVFLTAITNLFGVGGSTVVSGLLGEDRREDAGRCTAFCLWTAILIGGLYSLTIFFTRQSLLPLVGAGSDIYQYACDYLFWTICIGAIPTVISPVLANLIRAQGYSKQASFGVALGGILNILLDPIFIFVLRLEVKGAAIATMLSNVCAVIYFAIFIRSKKDDMVIRFRPKYYTLKKEISLQVFSAGLPNFMLSTLATFSNSVLNPLMAVYSTEALAALGIAKKIDLLAFAVAQGMSQGTLPIVSYNYSAGNKKRLDEIIRKTAVYGLIFAFCGTLLLFSGSGVLARLFIKDAATAFYAKTFLRHICFTCPTTTIVLMVISVFQGTGKKGFSLFVSALRKGLTDIPLILFLNKLYGMMGIIWAIPLADAAAMLVALAVFLPYYRKNLQI